MSRLAYVVKKIMNNYYCDLKQKTSIHEAFSLILQDIKLFGINWQNSTEIFVVFLILRIFLDE